MQSMTRASPGEDEAGGRRQRRWDQTGTPEIVEFGQHDLIDLPSLVDQFESGEESAFDHKADLCDRSDSQCWLMWFMQQTIGIQEQHGTRMPGSNNLRPTKIIPHLRMQGCFV